METRPASPIVLGWFSVACSMMAILVSRVGLDDRVQQSSEERRPVFVCWIGQQGRSSDLAALLDAELWLIESRLPLPPTPVTAPLRYIDQSIRTIVMILRDKPSAMIVMQPPVFVLAIVVALRGRRPVVADFHHDPFEEPKWRWSLRPSLWLARRCAVSIVTNEAHARIIRAHRANAVVLHDPPVPAPEQGPEHRSEGFVLVPSSYSADEPVAEIFDAARSLPDVEFRFTGVAPSTVRALAPSNVVFTGFVSDEMYRRLLIQCSAILCLTDKPNTMQRGGYEALSNHRPLVTADSEVLRSYFDDAAVYAAPRDSRSIAAAVQAALSSLDERRRRMAARHLEVLSEYPAQLETVRAALRHETRHA